MKELLEKVESQSRAHNVIALLWTVGVGVLPINTRWPSTQSPNLHMSLIFFFTWLTLVLVVGVSGAVATLFVVVASRVLAEFALDDR